VVSAPFPVLFAPASPPSRRRPLEFTPRRRTVVAFFLMVFRPPQLSHQVSLCLETRVSVLFLISGHPRSSELQQFFWRSGTLIASSIASLKLDCMYFCAISLSQVSSQSAHPLLSRWFLVAFQSRTVYFRNPWASFSLVTPPYPACVFPARLPPSSEKPIQWPHTRSSLFSILFFEAFGRGRERWRPRSFSQPHAAPRFFFDSPPRPVGR